MNPIPRKLNPTPAIESFVAVQYVYPELRRAALSLPERSDPSIFPSHSTPRIVRCGLIQASCEWSPEKYSLAQIKQKMMSKHEDLIASAAKKKVQVLGLQELFYGPYFCAEQQTRWYELTEPVPNGPTITLMQKIAK